MQLRVDFPHGQIDRFTQYVFADQLPFVEAVSINDSAKQAQIVQREHQREVFTVRRKSFVDRAVKIKPFATKRKPEAKISVDPPGGRARADILTQHEFGGPKTPIRGRSVAVPTANVRRTGAGIIRRAERPRRLLDRNLRGRRVFLRRDGTGRGTIFEEDSRGRLRVLYQLVPSVPLDDRLQFVENIVRSVNETYAENFVRRFDRAIRTAR